MLRQLSSAAAGPSAAMPAPSPRGRHTPHRHCGGAQRGPPAAPVNAAYARDGRAEQRGLESTRLRLFLDSANIPQWVRGLRCNSPGVHGHVVALPLARARSVTVGVQACELPACRLTVRTSPFGCRWELWTSTGLFYGTCVWWPWHLCICVCGGRAAGTWNTCRGSGGGRRRIMPARRTAASSRGPRQQCRHTKARAQGSLQHVGRDHVMYCAPASCAICPAPQQYRNHHQPEHFGTRQPAVHAQKPAEPVPHGTSDMICA